MEAWTPASFENGFSYYCCSSCKSPENHRDLFNGLVSDFCKAFGDGSLSQDLDLRLFHKMKSCGGSRRMGCDLCRSICESFPFKGLMKGKMCYSLRKRLPMIANRPGGQDFLRSKERLLEMLTRYHTRYATVDEDPDTGDYTYYCGLIDYTPRDLDMFDTMVSEYGCDASSIATHEAWQALGATPNEDPDDPDSYPTDIVLRRSTYDRLIALEIPLTARLLSIEEMDFNWEGGLFVCSDDDYEHEIRRNARGRAAPFPPRYDSSDDEEDMNSDDENDSIG